MDRKYGRMQGIKAGRGVQPAHARITAAVRARERHAAHEFSHHSLIDCIYPLGRKASC